MSEPVYRSRPGADAMRPASAEQAEQIAPGLWCSPGLSNSYLLTTAEGRVIVNTGMGFEGPVHRANFDAVDSSPVRYIIFTQGHVDHVGGLDSVRDPDTTVVAQANWTMWRDDNDRLIPYRASRSAFAFKDTLASGIQAIQRRLGTTRLAGQSVPVVDLDFEDTLTLEVGGRRMELISVPGGETTDSLVVWLPDERICLCGNTFGPLFGHIPNLVTMRGDRYRDALTAIASVERVRALQPDLLVTGHFEPIAGADRIDAELTRLRDAIAYVHDQTVDRDERRQRRPHLDARDRPARGIRSGPRLWQGRPGTCGRSGRTTRAGSTTARPPSCTRSDSTPSPPTWSSWPAPTRSWIAPGHTWPPTVHCTPSTSPSLFPPGIRGRATCCGKPTRNSWPQHELLGKCLAAQPDSEEFMTQFALRPEDFYHTGIIVPDLDAAMARLSALAGYRWITPLSYTLPFRTTSGTQEVTSTFVYSVQAPHIELIKEVPGTAWTAAPGNAIHHLGYLTDDLAESAKCWKTTASPSKRPPTPRGLVKPGLALFAYYVDACGTRIEIVDRALFPDFPAFLQAAAGPEA